jgi:hypothetical protein
MAEGYHPRTAGQNTIRAGAPECAESPEMITISAVGRSAVD